jgi:hypothetical protein
MAWTAPPSFTTGELVPASKMQIISDDLSYLLNRPKGSTFRDNGANYTTTSTSFVAVDSTNMKQTITMSGSSALVGFAGTVFNTDAGNVGINCLDITVDGVRAGAAGTDGIVVMVDLGSVTHQTNGSFSILVTGLSTGSHTFALVWRTNNSVNTVALSSGSGAGGTDNIPNVWAVEVS